MRNPASNQAEKETSLERGWSKMASIYVPAQVQQLRKLRPSWRFQITSCPLRLYTGTALYRWAFRAATLGSFSPFGLQLSFQARTKSSRISSRLTSTLANALAKARQFRGKVKRKLITTKKERDLIRLDRTPRTKMEGGRRSVRIFAWIPCTSNTQQCTKQAPYVMNGEWTPANSTEETVTVLRIQTTQIRQNKGSDFTCFRFVTKAASQLSKGPK